MAVLEDPDKITYFAQTNSRGEEIPFGIKRLDRARHMYVIGKTGVGKSTLLENMAIQDIRNGEAMAFIDPHGSTAERLLEYVPEHRIKDVVYFAPFDMDYPLAFNVMEDVGYDKRHLVVSGLLSAFRKIWVDAWSARMEYILSNVLLALLEYDGATLLDVNRMLVNKSFRKKVVDNITDPAVRSFWVDEFAGYTDRYTQEATPAIQNKIGQFTSNPLIRNIVGQAKSSFDIRQLMDERKILIINLSKGRVGEVNANLLGSMLVTKIYLAAMSRADVPAQTLATLPSFYFYVDEFQNFANQSFADILSEARKYKLNLIIAHQYIEQMEEEVRDAVFGNVGTTVAFRVGPFDAEVLETIFMPQFTKEDLVNLGKYQMYLTLMIGGIGSVPFSATTLPPFDMPPQRFVGSVLAASREQFAKPRKLVEDTLTEWMQGDEPNPPPAPAYGKSAPKSTSRPSAASSAPAKPQVETPQVPEVVPTPAVTRVPESEEVSRPPHTAHTAPSHTSTHSSPARPQERTHHHTPQAPHPRTVDTKPQIEGATSLREALAKATGDKTFNGNHAPDLKETLKKLAEAHSAVPKAAASTPPKQSTPTSAPVSIPEEKLRTMLKVDTDE